MEVDRPATPEKLVPGPQQRVDLPQFIQLGLMIIVVISQNSPYEVKHTREILNFINSTHIFVLP